MNDPRWTGDTVQLIADVIGPYTETYSEACNATRRVLAALADAGLLVEPGSETAGITAKRCDYTDRDLSTNRRLRCDKSADHWQHRLVLEPCTHPAANGAAPRDGVRVWTCRVCSEQWTEAVA